MNVTIGSGHGRRHAARALVRLALLAALWAAPGIVLAAEGAPPLVGRVDYVADGDTLTVRIGGQRHRIRLHEIDAPEQGQPGSREARRALADKVEGNYVRVQIADVDEYGRTVGKVWLGERDINRELVREGHAWAYRRYLDDSSLLEDEAAAREAGRGLWQHPAPVPPWEWRHGRRTVAAASAEPPEGCRIKGNVNRRGQRIYHRPGDRYYRETRIDPGRGERWFCSAEEAERAGWRPAR
ncbi:MAG TPA: thermonuclease family protein [Pseudomonadales bacterium]